NATTAAASARSAVTAARASPSPTGTSVTSSNGLARPRAGTEDFGRFGGFRILGSPAVSQNYNINGKTVWNVGMSTSIQFMRYIEDFEAELALPSGLGPMYGDDA